MVLLLPCSSFQKERAGEVTKRSRCLIVGSPPDIAQGGEHVVYGSAAVGLIIKTALPDSFGYVVDEESMLDDRTFMQVSKFKRRHSLPSEYFIRRAILDQVFGLQTEFCSIREDDKKHQTLVILQPFSGRRRPTHQAGNRWSHFSRLMVSSGLTTGMLPIHESKVRSGIASVTDC